LGVGPPAPRVGSLVVEGPSTVTGVAIIGQLLGTAVA
jgi:hypothetical protein